VSQAKRRKPGGSGNPFDQIPRTMLPVIAGLCDHPDDRVSGCPKCALTLVINRLIDEDKLPPERLFYTLVRLAAEAIGQSGGGVLKHQMLIRSFVDLLSLTVGVVEGERMLEERLQ
jgi:hypothetical protein